MAVYERTYKRYVGALTPEWSRFLVLPRYAFSDVFKRRFLLIYLVLCLVPTMVGLLMIYFLHSETLLSTARAMGMRLEDLPQISAGTARLFLDLQGDFAFFLTLFVGPGLISRDLANNGLPLYLSRPFSRAEYVLGKVTVLAVLLSAVTWVPGLLLWAEKGILHGEGWLFENLRMAFGIFVGSWAWILVLSLMVLAFSAVARWKSVTAFMMLFVYLGGKFFSLLVNNLFDTQHGRLLDLERVTNGLWAGLLGVSFDGPSPWASFGVLLFVILACLWLLNRKVRAYEVVS